MNIENLKQLIDKDREDPQKHKAREGIRYYKGEHDILDYRLLYFDSDGQVQEDKFRSNIKIPHQFHTELVDQKVQYLLSNPVEINTEDEILEKYLEEYINEDFQAMLQDLLEGASNKGVEYVYAYMDREGKLNFQVADSLKVIPIYDDTTYELEKIIYYYDDEIIVNGEKRQVTRAQVWTEKDVTYYIYIEGKKDYELDDKYKPNPRPHITLEDEDAIYDGGNLGYIPFFVLENNKYKKTDLEPIKRIIDDYDLMACSLSNNLQDFQDAIYVVKGYPGDNLDELVTNLKTRKTIGVDADGGIDVKTIDIPYEARKAKLELDKEAIYKFGMGFDSSQIGDGNITNVVIKSRYALLDLKCNKAEVRLRRLIRQLLGAIISDINRRYNTGYKATDVDIEIVRETMVNENDVYNNEKIQAETQRQLIDNLLVTANRLSDETVLESICNILDLDYEEEKQRLLSQDVPNIDLDKYSELLLQAKMAKEDDIDDEVS